VSDNGSIQQDQNKRGKYYKNSEVKKNSKREKRQISFEIPLPIRKIDSVMFGTKLSILVVDD
jgi:hypothetical protein